MPSPIAGSRVWESTTHAGLGLTVTLDGALAGFRPFSDVPSADGADFYYTIAEQNGVDWEVQRGTYTASGTTLTRTDPPIASSNAGALVDFAAGTKDVFCDLPAETAPRWDSATQTFQFSLGGGALALGSDPVSGAGFSAGGIAVDPPGSDGSGYNVQAWYGTKTSDTEYDRLVMGMGPSANPELVYDWKGMSFPANHFNIDMARTLFGIVVSVPDGVGTDPGIDNISAWQLGPLQTPAVGASALYPRSVGDLGRPDFPIRTAYFGTSVVLGGPITGNAPTVPAIVFPLATGFGNDVWLQAVTAGTFANNANGLMIRGAPSGTKIQTALQIASEDYTDAGNYGGVEISSDYSLTSAFIVSGPLAGTANPFPLTVGSGNPGAGAVNIGFAFIPAESLAPGDPGRLDFFYGQNQVFYYADVAGQQQLYPATPNAVNLGAADAAWKSGYFGTSVIMPAIGPSATELMTLPAANAPGVLTNDGSGGLSWV